MRKNAPVGVETSNMAESGKTTNGLLLAAFIVAATAGAMVWMAQSDDDADAQQTEQATEEVIEVEPMVPRARIAAASWRTGQTEASEEPGEDGASLIGSVEWENLGSDPEARDKYDASLEEAMKKVQGLSVVVAADDEDEDEPSKESPRKRK
ncbi:MAG: hypothetical protein ACYS0E_20230 [Planctomycetota bacterium]|jgi:hypothetical protein